MTRKILEEQWIRHNLKNPGLAALLSFLIMGLGQIYNGQLDKGLLLLFMEMGLLVAGAAFSMETQYSRAFVEAFSGTGLDFLVGALTAAFLLLWIYSVKDAHRGALMTYLALDPNFVPPAGTVFTLAAPLAENSSEPDEYGNSRLSGVSMNSLPMAGGMDPEQSDAMTAHSSSPMSSQSAESGIGKSGNSSVPADSRDMIVEYAYGKLAIAGFVLVLIAGGIGIFLGLSTGFRAKDRQIRKGIQRAEASPEDVTATKELGRLYMKYGDMDGAEQVFRRALMMKPDDVEIHVNLGNALQARGQTREAQSEFMKAAVLTSRAGRRAQEHISGQTIESTGKDGSGEVSQGSLAMIQDWMAAIKHNPTNVEAYYNLGIIYRQEGLLDEADYSLRKAIELDPSNLEAYLELASVLEAGDDIPGSVKCLERVYRERPEDTNLIRQLSRQYAAMDDFGRSLELTERLLINNPGDTDALRSLADLCDTTLQYDKGLAALDRLLEFAPGDVQALRKRASLCLKLHDTKGFISAFRELARQLPEDMQILRRLGQVLFEQGDTQGAREIYEKLAKLDSSSVDVYLKLADIYRRIRDLDAETLALEKGLKIDPSNPFFLKTLGDIYYRTGRNYDAVVVLEKFSARGSSDISVLRRLARLYSRVGDEKNEISTLEKLLSINSRDKEAADRLVAIHRRKREFVVVEDFYRKMLDLNPSDPEAHRNLANHYETIGNIEEAARVYKSLADLLTGEERKPIIEKIAILNERLGHQDLQQAALVELISMDPLATGHMKSLAAILKKKGDAGGQEKLFQKILAVDPSDEAALRELSDLKSAAGDRTGELECLQRLTLICPGDGEILLRAGRLSSETGKVQDACSYLDRAVRAGKASEALPLLADALEKTDDFPGLIRTLREICSLRPADPVFQRRLGNALLKSGDTVAAVEALEKAWNMAREDQETTNAYLKVCLDLRDTSRMIKVYEVMASMNPLDMEITASLATLHGQQGDTERARELWRRVRNLDRGNRAANENLLTMALARDELSEALEIIEDLQKSEPSRRDLVILKANLCMESGFVDKGVAILEDLLRKDPANLEALKASGDHFMKVHDYSRAIVMFERAAEQEPAEMGIRLGKAMMHSGDVKGALKAVRKAVDKGNESTEALILLARLYHASGKSGEANTTVERALVKEPENRSALLEMASLLHEQKKYKDGLSFVKRILGMDSGCLDAIVLGARMAGQSGMLQLEIEYLSKAVELAPEVGEYHFMLGQALKKNGDLKLGYSHLARASKLEPGLEYFMELARTAMLLSDFKNGLKSWEEALALEPLNPVALYGAGIAAVNLGEISRARECFATLIKVDGKNNLAHESLGNIYYNDRDFDKSTVFFRKAIDLKPREHGPYFKLGMALWELGKYSDARKVFLNLASLSGAPEALKKQARVMAEKMAATIKTRDAGSN
ncbi:MAG: hypothetical protein CVV64_08975 [Candidatus Wallbacteria bacterium HGW-Wallbacteria-1]|jgi:tetratricopeptide (TPR) repeat protein/TM2 domain-containing membrane protein YozV|uniref:Uncharacterized protein n=1 Tax=Candidatus Wallbacteria bacterium HGW-Wallbacteria-1 TaxID=2013854 RepID=A0A2N1PQ74_9BACT|nr:MAG: hypothetical protein CVV64_08975 [Candidatus Wallbacteria bacterium HGW-Wallbacteria-1]